MRRALLAVVTTLLATSVPPVARADCADVNINLRMFKIEAKWARKAYRVGETAKLRVHVSRTAEEDPVSEDGVPYPTGRPLNEPAAEVLVGIPLFVGDVFLVGGAVTNQRGDAVVAIDIEPWVRPGQAHGRGYAEKILIEDFPSSQCRVVIREYGQLPELPPLRIVD